MKTLTLKELQNAPAVIKQIWAASASGTPIPSGMLEEAATKHPEYFEVQHNIADKPIWGDPALNSIHQYAQQPKPHPFINGGITMQEASARLRDFAEKLKQYNPPTTGRTIIHQDELLAAIKNVILTAHVELRVNKNKDVTLLLPHWAIEYLKKEYLKFNFLDLMGFNIALGYENSAILFHPFVTLYGKEPCLYNEVSLEGCYTQ